MTLRSGNRDVAVISRLHIFIDQEYHQEYIEISNCLTDGGKFEKPFSPLSFEVNDQMLQVNQTDVRSLTSIQIHQLIKGLKSNDQGFLPRRQEVLTIIYVRADDFNPDKHLGSKVPSVNDDIGYCTRCYPPIFFNIPEPRRFPSKHTHDIKALVQDVSVCHWFQNVLSLGRIVWKTQ